VPYIWVNEVSTVASVYALSGFMTDLTHIGSSGTPLAQTAIANAFATVANLVGVSTGAALATTPAGNGTPPQAELNTLANILASCVNSAGTGSASCTTLFANAKNGNVQPVDTVTAALNIAHNPAANISDLFGLQAAAGAPYQPTLAAEPNDFTVSVVYSGGGMNAPLAIAIDGVGDVWMVNSGAFTLSKMNGVTGAAISPSTGFAGGGLNAPFSLAIDTSGNAWTINPRVTNPTTGATVTPASLSEFSSTGVPASGSPFSGGGLTISDSATSQSLRALAFDGSGNLWVANNASLSVSEFNGLNGQPLSPAFGYPLGSSNVDPDGIAVDSAQHVWVSGLYGNMLYEVSVPTGAVLFTSGSTSGFFEPNSIAIDASNDLWLTDQSDPAAQQGTVVSEFNASGGALGAYAGGGVLGPEGVAIDGGGNVWISNDLNGSVSELSNSGSPLSPSTGYVSASLPEPADIAIDLSGNVWVPNAVQPVSLPNGGSTVVNGTTVTEFVGAASPTVTPLAAAVASGKLGARP
jgi:streptogramin lyase